MLGSVGYAKNTIHCLEQKIKNKNKNGWSITQEPLVYWQFNVQFWFEGQRPLNNHRNINCLEHKHAKYMPLTHDKGVYLTNNEYVTYALLSLAGSMHLAGLCSKQ